MRQRLSPEVPTSASTPTGHYWSCPNMLTNYVYQQTLTPRTKPLPWILHTIEDIPEPLKQCLQTL